MDRKLRKIISMICIDSFVNLIKNAYMKWLCVITLIVSSAISFSADKLTAGDLFKMSVKEGDTIDMIGLIKDESYMLYGGMFRIVGCSVKDGTLVLNSTGADGFIEVGKNDNKWCDYEILGKLSLSPIPSGLSGKSFVGLDIAVHYNRETTDDVDCGNEIIRILYDKEVLLMDFKGDKEEPKKVVKKKTRLSSNMWYIFRIDVKGSSVAFYINDKKLVSSKGLSSKSGGFRIYPLTLNSVKYEVYFKDLKVKINKWGV